MSPTKGQTLVRIFRRYERPVTVKKIADKIAPVNSDYSQSIHNGKRLTRQAWVAWVASSVAWVVKRGVVDVLLLDSLTDFESVLMGCQFFLL